MLAVFLPLKDERPGNAEAEFRHAFKIFQAGEFEKSQQEAADGARRWRGADPRLASKFELLEAQSMLFRGMAEDALFLLSSYHPAPDDSDAAVEKLALESMALARQQKFSQAEVELTSADSLCRQATLDSCGQVLLAHGILAGREDHFEAARRYYLDTLAFVRTRRDRWSEAGTLINLGFAAIALERYDEALDWFQSARQAAVELGDENTAQKASGNLGWAYFKLGDYNRALEQFQQAEASAQKLGNVSSQLGWMSTAGYVYQLTGDLSRATETYRGSLELAKRINSREDTVNALEDLAEVSIDAGTTGAGTTGAGKTDAGKIDQASAYISQAAPLVAASGNRLDELDLTLARGRIAASKRDVTQAEQIFRSVAHDPASQTSMVLSAEHEIARLYEQEGRAQDADQMYRTTLATFESARAQLKSENSMLPFFANAALIYDDYIHFLIAQGRSGDALAAADQSRARTLAEGFGVAAGSTSFHPQALNPTEIAHKSGATLLFYWLGRTQSYLWAITPTETQLFPLPAGDQIAARVNRYRKSLEDSDEDPLETANQDGIELYRELIAPASKLIAPGRPVILLTDGALSQLNFETLLAPGPSPQLNPKPSPQPGRDSGSNLNLHYWIEDVTLQSAPSLAMLSAAKSNGNFTSAHIPSGLLLLGDPVSPNPDFPRLPLFAFEVKTVQKHFSPHDVAVFTSQRATPAAYLSSNPAGYSYIHFVTHAVSSSADPLDSAIILSGDPATAGSFKLYARDIMLHPIHARLVTISACDGSGTRSYAGEGLVGLSWAFLRAGAQNVIGALWEVSDESTPRLMDTLYQGLQDGQTPAEALRRGKLALLHSGSTFRAPYFWAPFELYTR